MRKLCLRVALLICLITGLPVLFLACSKGDIIGGHTTYQYFRFKDLTVQNGDTSMESGTVDSAVMKEDFYIGISNEIEMTAAPEKTVSLNLPFMSLAKAENLILVNVDTLTSLKIITLAELNVNYPAGSDVTKLFGIGGRDDLEDWQILHILSVGQILYGSRIPIMFKVPPASAVKDAQFQVIYNLDSGLKFESTTPKIDLI